MGYGNATEERASQGMTKILILHPRVKNFHRIAAHAILMNPQIVPLLFTFEPPRTIPEGKMSCRELRDSGIPSPSSLAITPYPCARPKAIFFIISLPFPSYSACTHFSPWPYVTMCLLIRMLTGKDRPTSLGCPHAATRFTNLTWPVGWRRNLGIPSLSPSSVDVVLSHAVCFC